MNKLNKTIIVGLCINTFLLTFYLVLNFGLGVDWFIIGLMYFVGLYLVYKFKTQKENRQ